MTETDRNNYAIISNLVENHFDLEQDSLTKFKHLLWNREIDPAFKTILGEDLRLYIPISDDTLESIDAGWGIFKNRFKELFMRADLNIKYENFKKNKLKIGNQEVKLFKAMKKMYLEDTELLDSFVPTNWLTTQSKEDYFEEYFQRASESIGSHKLPNKDLFLVFTMNVADMFLCATGESWDSCISAENCGEEGYWAGLPGIVGDRNRIMFYVTDKKEKNYLDIKADRMFTRAFGIITDVDRVHLVKSYPSAQVLTNDVIEKIMPEIEFNYQLDWVSKYPVDMLYNSIDESSYIYQDDSHFKKIGDEFFLESGKGGMTGVYNGSVSQGTTMFYGEGLKKLVEIDESISEYYEQKYCCVECDERVDDDDAMYDPEGQVVCSSCFYDKYEICSGCGEVYNNDKTHFVDGECLCVTCLMDVASFCEECDALTKFDEGFRGPDDTYICEDCYCDKYDTCEECDKVVDKEDLNEEHHCNFCAEAAGEKVSG